MGEVNSLLEFVVCLGLGREGKERVSDTVVFACLLTYLSTWVPEVRWLYSVAYLIYL